MKEKTKEEKALSNPLKIKMVKSKWGKKKKQCLLFPPVPLLLDIAATAETGKK